MDLRTESGFLGDSVSAFSLNQVPIPVIVHQGDTLLYVNDALRRYFADMGADFSGARLEGARVWGFIEEREVAEELANLDRLRAGAAEIRGVERTLLDSAGNRFRCVGSMRRIKWNKEEAFIVSFVPISKVGEDDRAELVFSLTRRERQIAGLLADGCSNENISAILDIRLPTVRSHLRAIYRKTRTTSRVDLARLILDAV